jgi:hypothetical protein
VAGDTSVLSEEGVSVRHWSCCNCGRVQASAVPLSRQMMAGLISQRCRTGLPGNFAGGHAAMIDVRFEGGGSG